jgi:TonB family protein
MRFVGSKSRNDRFRRTKPSKLFLACAATFGVAMSSPLWGQPAAQVPATAPANTPAAAATEASNTEERSCVSLMPNGLQSLEGKQIPVLVVRVGLDAKLHDARLPRSSGDPALDKALIRCADGHPFMPVTVHGQPAEVEWIMAYYVVPEVHQDGFTPASSNGQRHVCQNWPQSAVRRNLNGDATFSYRIGTDGSTRDIKLAQSTGDADLDKATLDCVASWKFFPAVQNGKPVEIDRNGGQHWRTHP